MQISSSNFKVTQLGGGGVALPLIPLPNLAGKVSFQTLGFDASPFTLRPKWVADPDGSVARLSLKRCDMDFNAKAQKREDAKQNKLWKEIQRGMNFSFHSSSFNLPPLDFYARPRSSNG